MYLINGRALARARFRVKYLRSMRMGRDSSRRGLGSQGNPTTTVCVLVHGFFLTAAVVSYMRQPGCNFAL